MTARAGAAPSCTARSTRMDATVGYQAIFDARGDAYHRAMSAAPDVRAREFEALVAHSRLEPGLQVVDVPSGGGYLARYLPPDVDCLHVETSRAFFEAARSDGRSVVLAPSLSRLPLPDQSVDRVLSLAGLHHEPDRLAIYREARRILKPSGWLLVAEVAEGSPVARFLDGFVDAHGDGHRGLYLGPKERDTLRAAGFALCSSHPLQTPWRARSDEELGAFCRELFWIHRASVSEVIEALRETIGVRETESGVELAWELCLFSCRSEG